MTLNVPSALIVHTVPRELVHVPASAAGPEDVIAAQAVISVIKAPAKTIRRECCSFMAGILSCGSVTCQAQIAAKRLVANDFVFDVEKLTWRRHRQFLRRRNQTGGSGIGNGSSRLAA